MKNRKPILSKSEIKKCKKILQLFQEFLDVADNIVIVKSDKCGYVILQDAQMEKFSEHVICRCVAELFYNLLEVWEYSMYDLRFFGQYDNFEEFQRDLDLHKESDVGKKKAYYILEGQKILYM